SLAVFSQLPADEVVIHPEARVVKLDLRHVRSIKPSEDSDQPSVVIMVTAIKKETRTRVVATTTMRPEQRTRVVNVQKMRTEQRTREVPVTEFKEETRTRTVKVDGKDVEQDYTVKVPVVKAVTQDYTVQVPYTEQVEQAYTINVPVTKNVEQSYVVSVPSEPEPLTVPVSELQAWDIRGKQVETDVVADHLSKPTAAFLLRRPLPDGGLNIDPSHLAVIRKDVLFLYSPTVVAKQEDRDPNAPVVP
ncbi:MAG: hypothetical protein AAF497_27285, partial [Planctomycetota bacterium]